MTVVIGLAVSDGVLMAADSMASDDSGVAFQTEKIFSLANLCVVGGSGTSSVIGPVRERLRSIEEAIPQSPNHAVALHGPINETQRHTYGQFVVAPAAPPASPASAFLLAGVQGSRPWLAEVDRNGMMSRYEDNLGYYAIGSGAGFAQMSMALMAHFDITSKPLEAAKLVAYRALDAVINSSSRGVGHPIVIWTVTEGDGCRRLDDDEMAQIAEMVGGWQEIEKESLDVVLGGPPAPGADMPEEV